MQTIIKINQKKLVKEYKKRLKDCEKEKKSINKNYLLKIQKLEIEVLEVMNKIQSLEIKTANEKISKKKVFGYIHIVLDTFKLEINSLRENYQY